MGIMDRMARGPDRSWARRTPAVFRARTRGCRSTVARRRGPVAARRSTVDPGRSPVRNADRRTGPCWPHHPHVLTRPHGQVDLGGAGGAMSRPTPSRSDDVPVRSDGGAAWSGRSTAASTGQTGPNGPKTAEEDGQSRPRSPARRDRSTAPRRSQVARRALPVTGRGRERGPPASPPPSRAESADPSCRVRDGKTSPPDTNPDRRNSSSSRRK